MIGIFLSMSHQIFDVTYVLITNGINYYKVKPVITSYGSLVFPNSTCQINLYRYQNIFLFSFYNAPFYILLPHYEIAKSGISYRCSPSTHIHACTVRRMGSMYPHVTAKVNSCKKNRSSEDSQFSLMLIQAQSYTFTYFSGNI